MSNLARGRLINCLDTAVIAWIITMYTLDQTIFRAILAFLFHWDIVRPQTRMTPLRRQTGMRNRLVCVLINQIVAIFMHTLDNNPKLGTDGYLHGSVITSFIGVLPPSTAKLIAGDLIILVLEIFTFVAAQDPEYDLGEQANILEPSAAIDSISGHIVDAIDSKRAFKFLITPIERSNEQPDPEQPDIQDNLASYLRTMVV